MRSDWARRHCGDLGRGVQFPPVETTWIETVLTFRPVLQMRAALVAAAAAALALFALASFSPTAERPRASVAEAPSSRAPIAAAVASSRDPLAVVSRAELNH